MSSFQSNQQITAQQFMNNLVTLYNDYWSDPAGVFDFNDGNHTTDLTRRKGWGQEQVRVKGITETSVSTGLIIEAEHLNSVVAQINAGLVHIDNSNTLLNSVAQNTLITAGSVETVRQKITNSIDPNKFTCNDDIDLSLAESVVSNNGVGWAQDLYIEHEYSFTDYNHARHFFNSGGKITIQLDMEDSTTPYNLVWDQIFSSFGWIEIGAVSSQVPVDSNYQYQAPNLVPNRGFYSLLDTFTTVFETAGAFHRNPGTAYMYAYAYAYVQSAYNSRRIRVEAKGDDSGPDFKVVVRVSLIEDADDNWDITGTIVANHGYKIADLSPDSSTSNMDPFTGIPGTTQYRFQALTAPSVTLLTGWTADDLPDAEQVNWSQSDPGVNWDPAGGSPYKFESK